MKKLNHIFTLLVVALIGLSLTACSNDDLDTNQYGGDVSLGAFGPCPVLRGGTLYFYGTNLDKVTEINLPGSAAITAIDVLEKGTHSKISITVPAEGGTEGPVTLKTATGKEITSSSPITFREDIVINKIYIGTDGNMEGNVGDILTIEGDYLNLMWGVTFTGGATVTDLVEHTRYKLSVVIPKEAASGKITLTDTAETPTELQSDDAITIVLPSATAQSATTLKAGKALTITGTQLDQIESIQLPGGVTIAEEDITKSDDGTSLTFTLPEAAADGDITLVTYSGQKIVAGTITTVTPTNLAVAGNVKNGHAMTVTGQDLDLVKSVAFTNAAYDGELTVTATEITIAKVPETAQEGDLTLTMENGKEVTVAYTLVKPTVTSADPASITAGEEVVIYGTDLDLVSAVVFPGDAPQTVEAKDFAAQEEEGIQLTIPAAAYGTGMELVLKNGADNIVISGILTIIAASDPAISEAPAGALAGDEVTIKGKNFNNVQNIYIGEYKVTRYTSKSNTEITFKVPADAAVGDYNIIMEDHDGNKFEGPTFSVIPAEIDLTPCCYKMDYSTQASFPITLAWSDEGKFAILRGKTPDVSTMNLVAGKSKMIFYFDNYEGQLQFNTGGWSTLFTLASWDADAGAVREVLFTQDMIDWCKGTQTDGWSSAAFIIQGASPSVKKVTILP